MKFLIEVQERNWYRISWWFHQLVSEMENSVREGWNAELDELRDIAKNGKTTLLKLKDQLTAETGIFIPLKFGYNNLGYYIEVH